MSHFIFIFYTIPMLLTGALSIASGWMDYRSDKKRFLLSQEDPGEVWFDPDLTYGTILARIVVTFVPILNIVIGVVVSGALIHDMLCWLSSKSSPAIEKFTKWADTSPFIKK